MPRKNYRQQGETLLMASRFSVAEKLSATERQRANIRSWGNTPITMPPKTEGRGDGYDAQLMPRIAR